MQNSSQFTSPGTHSNSAVMTHECTGEGKGHQNEIICQNSIRISAMATPNTSLVMGAEILIWGQQHFNDQKTPSITSLLYDNALTVYCNRTNFRTRFNFVYFVLFAESTKFSSIRKPYTYACVSDTTVAVRKFLAYESWQTLEYEIFTRTKISAITVFIIGHNGTATTGWPTCLIFFVGVQVGS